jgi:Chagasin family peptidase inhibitor I42
MPSPITGVVGQPVAIELVGGGGAGYIWRALNVPDGAQVHKNYIVRSKEPGASNVEIFLITFPYPGKYTITFSFIAPGSQKSERTVLHEFDISE